LNLIFLSYSLSLTSPSYGGENSLEIAQATSMLNGESSNTQRWIMPNHLGTHVDAPKHFIDSGDTVEKFEASYWGFEHPCCIDIKCQPGELVKPEQITGLVNKQTDLLLIRTGFEKHRGEDIYWQENPGLHPDLADWLKNNYPTIRAVGLDSISISSWGDRQTGRAAHKRFLGGDKPILIIEDMKLSIFTDDINRIIVAPLVVDSADGAPCTVFAILKDNV
jgi:kynurenine formamidase